MWYFVSCVLVRGPVGDASPGAFGWCMIIEVRFSPKTSSLITIFNEVRTITHVTRSRVIRFVFMT